MAGQTSDDRSWPFVGSAHIPIWKAVAARRRRAGSSGTEEVPAPAGGLIAVEKGRKSEWFGSLLREIGGMPTTDGGELALWHSRTRSFALRQSES